MSDRSRYPSWFISGATLSMGVDAAVEGHVSLASVCLFFAVGNAVCGYWPAPSRQKEDAHV